MTEPARKPRSSYNRITWAGGSLSAGASGIPTFLGSKQNGLCSFGVFCFFRTAPATYGGSQARGGIGATAAGLHHNHSNAGSEPCLRPTPQLTATPDPEPTERGQGSHPHPYGS